MSQYLILTWGRVGEDADMTKAVGCCAVQRAATQQRVLGQEGKVCGVGWA